MLDPDLQNIKGVSKPATEVFLGIKYLFILGKEKSRPGEYF